jgi:hypothetical protein
MLLWQPLWIAIQSENKTCEMNLRQLLFAGLEEITEHNVSVLIFSTNFV